MGTGAALGAGTGLVAGSAIGVGNADAAGGSLQVRYDTVYAQCMTAKGNRIGGPSVAEPMYVYPPPYYWGLLFFLWLVAKSADRRGMQWQLFLCLSHSI
jgi:hypothetical protein